LFFPEVIYEHGEPWWIDVDRVKLLIYPPELSGSPTSSHLEAKQEELPKEIVNFALPLPGKLGLNAPAYLLTCSLASFIPFTVTIICLFSVPRISA
jgi:hypothetical protein